jgi:hypothetical protein
VPVSVSPLALVVAVEVVGRVRAELLGNAERISAGRVAVEQLDTVAEGRKPGDDLGRWVLIGRVVVDQVDHVANSHG